MTQSQLQSQMWTRLQQRLHEGEPMVTSGDFEAALESEFHVLTGSRLPDDTRAQLRLQIGQLHTEHPETYLAQGVKNAVRHAFEAGIQRLSWQQGEVERSGWQVIRRFLRSDPMRELLVDIHLDPATIDASSCVRQAIDNLDSFSSPAARQAAPALAAPDLTPPSPGATHDETHPARLPRPKASVDDLKLEVTLAAEAAGIDKQAAAERVQEQEELRVVLSEREMQRLPETLSVYVADGLIQEPQAEQLRGLLRVDERQQSGEIDAEEAESQKDEILTVEKRRDLDATVRKAVDATVGYIQVFESLKRISGTYDSLLKLLIEHKAHVTAADSGDRTALLGALSSSETLLELATGMMERSDSELRLLAIRLPPYNKLVPTKLQPLAHLTVEPDFVDDLRTGTAEELSERFRVPEPAERARPAADILSLIHLIDHVVEPTPFRFKLRMLIANQILQELKPRLEEMYGKGDIAAARQQAERILRQRLHRRFTEATREEQQAAHKRGQATLIMIEQALAAEAEGGAAEVEEALVGGPTEGEDGLTADEVERGVQLVRVEVRVAGRPKKIPTRIMPDPDDASKQVMAHKDPETGDLTPQMRRGKKRYVERANDGTWKAA